MDKETIRAIIKAARERAEAAANERAWEYDHAEDRALAAVERHFTGFADKLSDMVGDL